jgi:serine/threonine-protein kinase HipA
MIEGVQEQWIAKFSSSSDHYNVVKGEFLAMRLAAAAGLDVAQVHLQRAAGKDALLVRRFDRVMTERGYTRKAIVSGLTLLGLDELMARYASYEDLAEKIRHDFAQPQQTLRELFARMTFNVLCGNTDDHARNHAAFWDGQSLQLTPAFDICPQARTGNEASQAILIHDNQRSSRLLTCLHSASNFLLDQDQAIHIMGEQIRAIDQHFDAVCEQGELSPVERNLFRLRTFLNPSIFDQAPEPLRALGARFREKENGA